MHFKVLVVINASRDAEGSPEGIRRQKNGPKKKKATKTKYQPQRQQTKECFENSILQSHGRNFTMK
jgi:hypothetical protein